LAAMCGLELDPWQQLVLREGLGERPDGKWSAPEVAVVCPRQNGKNAILEARELAGLFLLGERLIVHSAHQYDTSMEAYRRLKALIENMPEFDKRVRRYINAHGTEGIELKGGQRIRFRTRTKGGGRGFSGDCVIFDEAMEFPEASLAAILPIVSAQPNPQIWYTGSAVDQLIHDNGVVLSRVRARGLSGTDERLAYFEWSVDAETPDAVTPEMAADLVLAASANPAVPRIPLEYIEGERAALGRRSYAVERLGVGDWPALDGGMAVIDYEAWKQLLDSLSRPQEPVCFGFDVTPDRQFATIAVAGKRSDGLAHAEIVEHRRGTGWIPERIRELVAAHRPLEVVCDSVGAAASLVPELERLGVQVQQTKASEFADACGLFYDMVDQAKLRHLGHPALDQAVRGGTRRALGERWVWDRRSSATDLSPLVASTLALWRLLLGGPSVYEERGLISFSL